MNRPGNERGILTRSVAVSVRYFESLEIFAVLGICEALGTFMLLGGFEDLRYFQEIFLRGESGAVDAREQTFHSSG